LALSLVFPDAECNEETVQRSVARSLGLPQVLASFDQAIGSQGMLRAALDMSSKWSMPLLNTYYPAYHFLGLEGQQRGYKTILTGGGGDEWLSVSPYYAADLLRRLHLRGLYQLWNNMQRSYPLPRLVLLRNVLWKFGARLLLGEMVKKRAPWVFHIRRRLLQSPPRWVAPDPVLRREITQRAEESGGNPDVESLYEREMRRALDHPLVSWEMEEAFESGRRLGMTVRQPFWDAELVELLYRTPPELLDRGGRAKGLVRQMVARRFPGLGFERQKKVLATNFFNARVLQEGKDAWQAMGGASALAQLGIVEEGSLRSTVTGILVRNDRRKAFHIWDVLNLEAWLRTRL
jgi:asparagine synthetase B (glutamine-hydrolysing)